jgi:hypothetical protein
MNKTNGIVHYYNGGKDDGTIMRDGEHINRSRLGKACFNEMGKAILFVDRNRGLTPQNEEVAIDNDAARS